jgi:hypothetical protein
MKNIGETLLPEEVLAGPTLGIIIKSKEAAEATKSSSQIFKGALHENPTLK